MDIESLQNKHALLESDFVLNFEMKLCMLLKKKKKKFLFSEICCLTVFFC